MSHPNSKETGPIRTSKYRKRESEQGFISITLSKDSLLPDGQHPPLRGTLSNQINLQFNVKEAKDLKWTKAHVESQVYSLEGLQIALLVPGEREPFIYQIVKFVDGAY
jgi:hypothetical protein